MNRVWVAIADENEIFRSSFVQYLNGTQEIVVVAEADSGQAAIELVKLHRPDVLLMDSSLSGLDGYEATKIIASKFPETKVIILTMCDSEEHREKDADERRGIEGGIRRDRQEAPEELEGPEVRRVHDQDGPAAGERG